jgi:hypothetical protein
MSAHSLTLELDDDTYAELAVAARDRGEEPAAAATRILREALRAYMVQMEAERGFPQA